MLDVLLAIASVAGGAIAAVAGFGIGSVVTPVLASAAGTKLAVAAVAIPHFAGTALRFWRMRAHIDRRILWSFGLTSAAFGLAGALLHNRAGTPVLTWVFAGLLVFAGLMGITGFAQRFELHGPAAWVAGGLSGLFGGLVGNQGGIRSAAMLGLRVSKESFVATATAIALMVDVARLPVYLVAQGAELVQWWPAIAIATVGVVIGTLGGVAVLRRIPDNVFRRIVAALVLALGVWMAFQAAHGVA